MQNEPTAAPTGDAPQAQPVVLSKADILGRRAVRVRRVPIPEWGGEAYIRIMPGSVVNDLSNEQRKLGGENTTKPMEVAAAAVVRGLCDAEGRPVFETNEAGAVANLEGDVLVRLSREILEFNGLTEDAVKGLKGN